MQYLKDKQFLTITCLLFISAAITVASASCPVTVIDRLTSMYASL